MLGKMLIHGLVAAIIVGAAAAVYAQVRGEAPLTTLIASDNHHGMENGHDD